MKKEFLEAGKIVNTHGVRGELKLQPWADSADFLRSFSTFYIDDRAYPVLSSRVHKNMLIFRLEGIEDVNAAMRMKNKIVFLRRADAKLPKGHFFLQDIMGAVVKDESGAVVGELVDVLETPRHHVYVVRGEREIMIPAVPAFILKTDVEAGEITVRLIEGM